ncbi:DegT/DnrJ/EryC1/StrS family aminotransferase [Desulforamulus aquiferis]|uniref:DegT/DnrJ/EryC1/StrS aminotransferase family protein n=1 Tax=Desulforamulus aquiferis TaxID=1397668 RepID=A0AAW7ZH50_9FIRM|nr:DegT/DnrJ/EryC1/StrS aminotransferase family protein [Desulforamulus aquiferis]MDO7788361.1 DegT/DnrJ/EryC1/StrS aminotransferase family protein [Desulforamulus aquiferis]
MKKINFKIKEFEENFAKQLGASYAVSCATGTAALHAALYAAGISHKDEVILSPLAHPETAHAIRYLDGVPIYTDIDPLTGCLDPKAVKMRLSSNTKAVIATHYTGIPCDIDSLNQVLGGREVVLIENASQALGAVWKGRKIGTISPLTIFDFSFEQSLYTELGGMVVTDSLEYYRWLCLFRDEGMMYDRDELVKEEGPWYYEAQEIGYNYRLTSMQAEIGLRQLPKLEQMQTGREETAEIYFRELAEIEGITFLNPNEISTSAWYSFPVVLEGRKLISHRREIIEELRGMGIQADVQYYPIYLHPIYLWQGHPDVCTIEGPLCPRAEEFYSRVINLPIQPSFDNNITMCIVSSLKKLVQKFNK